jgi:hypothetical protein
MSWLKICSGSISTTNPRKIFSKKLNKKSFSCEAIDGAFSRTFCDLLTEFVGFSGGSAALLVS